MRALKQNLKLLILGALTLLQLATPSLAAASSAKSGADRNGLSNTNVIRHVYLDNAPYTKEQIGVVVQNEHKSKVFKSYIVAVPSYKTGNLCSVEVRERKSGDKLEVMRIADGVDKERNVHLYQATLRKELHPNDKISLNVDLLYSNTVEPKPKRAKQTEDQYWEWSDSPKIPSIYKTKKQKTVVHSPSEVKGFYSSAPVVASKSGKEVTFGPFTEAEEPEIGNRTVSVDFRNNAVQLEAHTHRREYFVSHWGDDLNVLDYYSVQNRGPEIDGEFNKVRQTIAKFMQSRDNFVKQFLTKIPATARDLYFVDEIGNVSTSSISRTIRGKPESPFKVLNLQPRFSLAGGWNYTWWHGYSVSLGKYLKVDSKEGGLHGSRYHLKVPFIGSISGSSSQTPEHSSEAASKDNIAINDYELQITLPEGATDIDVTAPFEVESVRKQPLVYYLDSTGRTVVVIKHTNVGPSMHKDILVSYSYSGLSLWQKPIVVASLLFGLFVLASIVNRLHFGLDAYVSSSKSASKATKSKKSE